MEGVYDELIGAGTLSLLEGYASALAESYRSARPFPHAVIDDFFPAEVLRRGVEAFPMPGELDWLTFEGKNEKKQSFQEPEKLPPPLRDILWFLNSPQTLKFLEGLTGIEGLIADPYYYGGGLHKLEPGGFLDVHTDFNMLVKFNLFRRLNLLLYLNEDWPESYGGQLELWNRDMSRCEKRIAPIFNRCVIFNTNADSFHGNPNPVACPPGRARLSIATYYYTAAPIDKEKIPWVTTVFKDRPPQDGMSRLKRAMKKVLPPILVDAYKRMRSGNG